MTRLTGSGGGGSDGHDGAPLIEMRDVDAGYGGAPVLRRVSLALGGGSFTALIGPNGGGKSTLLRTASRMLRPSRGTVLLAGNDVRRMSQSGVARIVGFVPQSPQTDLEFTVEDVVLMGRYPHLSGMQRPGPRDLAAAEEAMRATAVLDLRHRRLAELSGGEAQRALIARCLAQKPRLLLLDEPTSHLDLAYQVEIMALLKRLNATDGLSILAVLHDLNLATQFFSHFLLISGGRIVSEGGADDVLSPGLLGEAYGADIDVLHDAAGGVIRVLARPPREPRAATHGGDTHDG
ncbi:MAG: ABC transporter ATP-binding protein [Bacillota bacterium]|nr:ABC transporter ATP-binding protein [Bacillota bacterium]